MKGRPDYISLPPPPSCSLTTTEGRQAGSHTCACLWVCTCMCGKRTHGGPQASEMRNNSCGRLCVHSPDRPGQAQVDCSRQHAKTQCSLRSGDSLYKNILFLKYNIHTEKHSCHSVSLDEFPETEHIMPLPSRSRKSRAGPRAHSGYF